MKTKLIHSSFHFQNILRLKKSNRWKKKSFCRTSKLAIRLCPHASREEYSKVLKVQQIQHDTTCTCQQTSVIDCIDYLCYSAWSSVHTVYSEVDIFIKCTAHLYRKFAGFLEPYFAIFILIFNITLPECVKVFTMHKSNLVSDIIPRYIMKQFGEEVFFRKPLAHFLKCYAGTYRKGNYTYSGMLYEARCLPYSYVLAVQAIFTQIISPLYDMNLH